MKVRLETDVDESVFDELEGWRKRQPATPSRRETLRFLIEKGLEAVKAKEAM
jgi:hypothetical protein